jgi:hypothetical protein
MKKAKTFFDTYSTIAQLSIIRVILSLVASHGLLVHQMDIKTTFLNGGAIGGDLYGLARWVCSIWLRRHVCKLLKSLYGLKQAPK